MDVYARIAEPEQAVMEMMFTEEMIAEDEKRWNDRNIVAELGYCGKNIRHRKNITNDDIRFYAYIMRKAYYMLKEQEPKKIIRKQMSYEDPDGTITYYAEWHCPHCNKVVQKGFDSPWLKYCFNCGKPILWD